MTREEIIKFISPVHTHAELVYLQNPDQIVYREKDVVDLIQKLLVAKVGIDDTGISGIPEAINQKNKYDGARDY